MKIYVFLLFVVSILNYICASSSGFYVDNGKDQTVLDKSMSRKQKLNFEKTMLNILGVRRKPKRHIASSNLYSSGPQYLLDVYNSLEGSKRHTDFNLDKDLPSVIESDVIMTFPMKGNDVNNMRHEKGIRLLFDVSDVPVGDTIVGAELRLHKFGIDEIGNITISVYQVLLDYNGERQLANVNNVNVLYTYEGWLLFNITSPFTTWIAFPSMNEGLYISVHKHSNPGHEIHPETVGLVSSIYDDTEDRQPFVTAFFKYGSSSLKSKIRRIRDVRKRRQKTESDVSYNFNPFLSESAWTLRSCQIQTLYVNFKDLNWQDWIIAPDGFASYYCGGVCDFPLNAHMNATNHAIVQTLVNLINPNEAPKSTCAPLTLGSMAVLYYLEDNSVILKKYKNMVVKSCGCH